MKQRLDWKTGEEGERAVSTAPLEPPGVGPEGAEGDLLKCGGRICGNRRQQPQSSDLGPVSKHSENAFFKKDLHTNTSEFKYKTSRESI